LTFRYISIFLDIWKFYQAIGALAALAQQSRLKIFRLLVQRGPNGSSGIARRLRLPQNILSFHIATLARSRLVASRKESRSIIYFVDLQGTQDLLSFLVEDCCGGNAELCGPLVASAETGCCPA
jgi:ArsR family transcriptional regulator, arsenate/arsenite/antimonite-responsive transcriptional repressor